VDPLMEQEDEPGIMKALDIFLKAHPKSSGAWESAIIRQAYRLMNGKVDQEDLAEVRRLQANPLPGQEPRARTLLGQYLMELRKPEEVVELIEPVIKAEPTMINHFQLGAALAALGEREDAIQVLREGLEAIPGDLAESQVGLLKTKMQALIEDLEKGPEDRS
jgi:tetratricopeptide (TPR) repeat protein